MFFWRADFTASLLLEKPIALLDHGLQFADIWVTFSSVPRKVVQIRQSIKVMSNKQDFSLDSQSFSEVETQSRRSLINHGDLARTLIYLIKLSSNVQFAVGNKGIWPFITLLVEIMEYLFKSIPVGLNISKADK